MSSTANKKLVRRYFEQVWNRGDMAAADEIIARDYNAYAGGMSGLEAAKLYISSYRSMFPGTHFTVLSMAAEGNKVAVCWASRGTHRSASEHPCPVTGMSIYRISNGKIAGSWIEQDSAGIYQRSGVLPCTN